MRCRGCGFKFEPEEKRFYCPLHPDCILCESCNEDVELTLCSEGSRAARDYYIHN